VTYRIEYARGVKQRIIDYRKTDPNGVDQSFDAINALARAPRPRGAQPYGSPDILRIHVGRYRLMYEVHDEVVMITVFHVGRLP
jgi:mRNA interferase RelE/StbE